MTPEELTQVVTAHQVAISRHDAEMAEIRATLNRIATSQEQTQAQQAINQEQLNQFTAGMIDLRDQVANSIQSREQTK